MTMDPERAFFAQVDGLLTMLGERAARVVLAGDLNAEQQANVQFILTTTETMRGLFRDEARRLGYGDPQE